jgi:Reverse transcriptase (RNA-dependent DNA polymerase)
MAPFIFNIAIYFLARWIARLSNLQLFKQPFQGCRSCLLYADDVLIFLRAQEQQLKLLKMIFLIFQSMSGLKLNAQKSMMLVTVDRTDKVNGLAAIMQCQASKFPIMHLGLPLSDKKLPKDAYNKIFNNEERRLAGWKADLLSIGGRLVLLNSILTTQLAYFMSVFVLPKWVIMRLEKIQRRFLWHGHKEKQGQTRPVYLASWLMVTRSKRQGALGVRDLTLANHSLMIKWMWWWVQERVAWWKEATSTFAPHIRPWELSNRSRFWSSMKVLVPIFESSVRFQVGQGDTIQFWHDRWLENTLKNQFPSLYQCARYTDIAVSDCYQAGQWQLQFNAEQGA